MSDLQERIAKILANAYVYDVARSIAPSEDDMAAAAVLIEDLGLTEETEEPECDIEHRIHVRWCTCWGPTEAAPPRVRVVGGWREA